MINSKNILPNIDLYSTLELLEFRNLLKNEIIEIQKTINKINQTIDFRITDTGEILNEKEILRSV